MRQMTLVDLSDIIKNSLNILTNTANVKLFWNKFTIALIAVSKKIVNSTNKTGYMELAEFLEFKIWFGVV